MDDTQQSRASDATATRKRRSSILKSQRPPRAPLSELEFNVATPTDTAKSRRVSFSRRTGVAEFATNEATTTWKNFYEEHNRTLESSGNESEMNLRRSVPHLGKRMFEDQFQEVEAVDFVSTLKCQSNFELGISKVEFDNVSLCSDVKLENPGQNLEFSNITGIENTNKLFGNDIIVSDVENISNKINMNFSAINPLESDDLDEIQKDVERQASNVQNMICSGPSGMRNMSEYIEVVLNTTHAALEPDNDATASDDMSITDTIHSPKVNVSKNNISDQKNNSNKDWAADKENIVVNPYIAPKESNNFVINEESDKVLVFDGKRLTIQSEKEPLSDYRKTLIPNVSTEKTPQRKTIVLNVDDDLPNFVANPHASISQHSRNLYFDETDIDNNDISLTQPLVAKIESNSDKRKTILYDESAGNISITNALPSNIVLEIEKDKRRTIVFDNDIADISVTEAVHANVIIGQNESSDLQNPKRKTIVFEDEAGNVSITQALPTNFMNESVKRQTIVYKTDTGNISLTEIIKEDKTENRKTILFDEEEGNISVTQAIPSNLIIPEVEKCSLRTNSVHENVLEANSAYYQVDSKTNVEGKKISDTFNCNEIDISMTQALPSNIISVKSDNTLVYNDDCGDISITQAVPTNLILAEEDDLILSTERHVINTLIPKKENSVLLWTETDKQKTLNEDIDISMTQALPLNVILSEREPEDSLLGSKQSEVLKPGYGDISVTQVIPNNMVLEQSQDIEKDKTITYDDNICDISMTQELPEKDWSSNNLNIPESDSSVSSSKTTITQEEIDPNEADISMTDESEDVVENCENKSMPLNPHNKLKNISKKSYDPDFGSLPTQRKSGANPIPSAFISLEKDIFKKHNIDHTNKDVSHLREVVVYQTATSDNIKQENVDESLNTKLKKNVSVNGGEDIVVDSTEVSIGCTAESNTSTTDLKSSVTARDNVKCDIATVSSQEESLEPSVKDKSCSDVNIVINTSDETRPKDKILDHLLNMNDSVFEIDKGVGAKSFNTAGVLANAPDSSRDSLFLIIRDSYESQKSDDEYLSSRYAEKKKDVMEIQFKDNVEELQKKILEMQSRNASLTNRHYEEIVSPGYKRNKSFLEADNTKELLDALSKLTERDEETKRKETDVKRNLKSSLKTSAISGRSVVVSREDLMNNISLASALLEKGCGAESEEKSSSDDEQTVFTRSGQTLSPDVVKTLRFEDDDSDVLEFSTLRKSTFGKSFDKEEKNKAHVIPTYLKDVSDGIKQLIGDLLKPMRDDIPFQTCVGTDVKRPCVKTRSMDIQANLITSSQVDIDQEIYSASGSILNLAVKRVKGIMKHNNNNNASSSETESSDQVDNQSLVDGTYQQQNKTRYGNDYQNQQPVLVFDPMNPLNNILISPTGTDRVHRYNPLSTVPCFSADTNQVKFKDDDEYISDASEVTEKKISENFNIHSVIPNFPMSLKGSNHKEVAVQKENFPSSFTSSINKPLTFDQSVGTLPRPLKNTTINTVIAMQDNKKLLEASSSLTLVDDSNNQLVLEANSSKADNDLISSSVDSYPSNKSPLELIYKQELPDSDVYSLDDEKNKKKKSCKKRKISKERSPIHQFCTLSSLDVLPPSASSPAEKKESSPSKATKDKHSLRFAEKRVRQQRVTRSQSKSPAQHRPESGSNGHLDRSHAAISKLPTDKKQKSNRLSNRPAPVTVQQVLVKPVMAEPLREDSVQHKLDGSPKDSRDEIEDIRSFSSCKSETSGSKGDWNSMMSETGKDKVNIEWHPELINEPSSKDLVTETEPDIDVIDKINMLPFLGTCECKWEFASGEEWRFFLLYGRLKLNVRLEPKCKAERWGRVRADTAVTAVSIQSALQDKRNAAAVLCVRFAAEAMRFFTSAGCRRAGEVPALLRRCAGVARVALRWRQVMHHAWMRLAYDLSCDGHLTVKVANVPLRSIWEVSMRIELVVDEAQEVPWPRASNVRVTPVIGAVVVPRTEVQCVLQHVRRDWGHAPKTLIKIFKYLKNKTHNDALFGPGIKPEKLFS